MDEKKELNEETNNNENNVKGKSAEDKKRKQTIIILCVALIVVAVALAASLITLTIKSVSNKNTTKYTLSSTEPQESTGIPSNVDVALPPTDEGSTSVALNGQTLNRDSSAAAVKPVRPRPTASATKNQYVEQYEQLSENGKNMLSDKPDNEFIKLIAERYNVDKKLLVAIYSVPDSGTNFVLQFNGQKDSKGKIIKSPDTLQKVYQIDKQRNIKIATGGVTGNVGVSYAEGMFCFHMVKTLVMEQYPNYFTGLRK